MNQLQVFNFGMTQVRTVEKDGQPWFVLSDVCKVLDIGNPSDVKTRLDDGVVSIEGIHDALGRLQQASIINEDGLYDVILESRKPEARSFRKWITSEVIPSIRKTGSYNANQIQTPQTLTEALRLALELSEKNEQISAVNKELSLKTLEQQQKLKEQEAPVAIYNLAISAQNTMSMQEVAKSLGTGRTKLYEILREEEVIMKNSTLPYQRYLDAGYFKVTERPRTSGDGIVNDPATRVYAKGFDFIARLLKRRAERLAKRLEMEA